ncbi:hypothetical protein AWC04_19550 [Mycolicibacterium fallax]|uniref:AAA+ ATPase domain-containing protein n=1 Tax=Mycolicibacterium fallax TaxID=1793 RepID=A0A1X1QZA5_MYCFA|nr:hypothetical protein AWC04_19550 [Mycolicibacterium fallax]
MAADAKINASLADWLDRQPITVRETLAALGQLLSGGAVVPDPDVPEPGTRDAWIAAQLGGVDLARVCRMKRGLGPVDGVRAGLALGELVHAAQPAQIGPRRYGRRRYAELNDALTWLRIEGPNRRVYTYPHEVALATDALAEGAVVVAWEAGDRSIHVEVIACDEGTAAGALDELIRRGREGHDPYRGGVWRADGGGSYATLEARPAPALTRADVAVDPAVWAELDLAAASITTEAVRMRELALGGRRGVLLTGPPGTGKSAAVEVIAGELAGTATVVYLDGRSAAYNLQSVTAELVQIGGPILLIIEDIDLAVGGSRGGSIDAALGQFLAAMDEHRDEPILLLATANTTKTLDPAAVRAARFDATVEVGYPDLAARAAILDALCARISGDVDTAAVAEAAPPETTGADLREAVRRCVLVDGSVNTAGLRAALTGRQAEATGVGVYL